MAVDFPSLVKMVSVKARTVLTFTEWMVRLREVSTQSCPGRIHYSAGRDEAAPAA